MIKETLAYWGCPLGKPVKPPGGWGPAGPPKWEPDEEEDPKLAEAARAAKDLEQGLGNKPNTPAPAARGKWVGPGAASESTPNIITDPKPPRWVDPGSGGIGLAGAPTRSIS